MNGNERIAKASPTKDFFVSMLVRDILLKQAILELIDNSIDGARKIQAEGKNREFKITIDYDTESFSIVDNCGGIPLDIATDYAFRFGKSSKNNDNGVETTGTYGVGMKRALFKMGRHFNIKSETINTSFMLDVDVDEWKQKDDEWDFRLSQCYEGTNNVESDTGTEIKVDSLYPEVSKELNLSSFKTELISHVNARLGMSIGKSINITINGYVIEGIKVKLVNSEWIKPIKDEYIDKSGVSVRIIAGIAPKDSKTGKYVPEKAGWYIYCNDRLIVAADKSSLTTWKDLENKSSGVSFTNAYAPFQGVVMFNSPNVATLPWNTSKTGIDGSSLIYVSAREKMVKIFRIVKDAIEKMRLPDDEACLDLEMDNVIENMSTIELSSQTVKNSISNNREMNIEKVVSKAKPVTRISYVKSKEEVERVKENLGIDTNREVGEKTFEYYIDAEC